MYTQHTYISGLMGKKKYKNDSKLYQDRDV